MRIGIIADSLDTQYAGIHYYTKHLLNALMQVDEENEYYIVRKNATDNKLSFYQEIIPSTINTLRLDPVRTFYSIPEFFNRKKVDVVVEPAHFGPFNLPSHIARVTVIHDLTPLLLPQFHPAYSVILQKLLLKKILKQTDLIIANSDNTKRDIVDFFPYVQDRIRRIYLGKDETIRYDNSRIALDTYNINGTYILFVGTIEPRKNLLELLKAYQIFREKGNSQKLVLVGKRGWKNKEFDKQLENHPFRNDIIRPGYVKREDLPALYSHADAFVYPSIYEGFGFPVLEAMSCKVPVVVSDSSSLPEIGGQAVLTYPLGNITQLAEQIHRVCNDFELSDELRRKGIKQAEKFSWQKCAVEFKEAIEQLR